MGPMDCDHQTMNLHFVDAVTDPWLPDRILKAQPEAAPIAASSTETFQSAFVAIVSNMVYY